MCHSFLTGEAVPEGRGTWAWGLLTLLKTASEILGTLVSPRSLEAAPCSRCLINPSTVGPGTLCHSGLLLGLTQALGQSQRGFSSSAFFAVITQLDARHVLSPGDPWRAAVI